MAGDPKPDSGEAEVTPGVVVSKGRDRPVRIMCSVVAVALGLSLVVPFAVVSVQDGSAAAFRWLLKESGGLVAALVGCLVATVFLGRYRNRNRQAESDPPAG